MRVLILSVTAGFGHHATAKAIGDMLESKGAEVHTLDVYAYISNLIKTTIDKARYIIDNANLYCFLITDCGWKPDYIWEILNSSVKDEIADKVINKWKQGYAS